MSRNDRTAGVVRLVFASACFMACSVDGREFRPQDAFGSNAAIVGFRPVAGALVPGTDIGPRPAPPPLESVRIAPGETSTLYPSWEGGPITTFNLQLGSVDSHYSIPAGQDGAQSFGRVEVRLALGGSACDALPAGCYVVTYSTQVESTDGSFSAIRTDELLLDCNACGGAPAPDGPPMNESTPSSGSADADWEDCPPSTSGPTVHDDTIYLDETWTADSSPHVVAFDISTYANITLEPCTEVLIDPGYGITVNEGASIVGIGSSAQPIRIAASKREEPFESISVRGGTLRLSHASIEDGGSTGYLPLYGDAMIEVTAAEVDPEPWAQGRLDLEHVIIRNSASMGVLLTGAAGFSKASREVVITGNASYPVSMGWQAVGSLPAGEYTGNAVDGVLLSSADVRADTTVHDRGVPYVSGSPTGDGQLRVVGFGDAPPAVLTIEPGVIFRFARGGALYLDYFSSDAPASSALVAVGTESKPIVFTSDVEPPAAGAWLGIIYRSTPAAENRIEHVRVEYAGAHSERGYACSRSGYEGLEGAAILISAASQPVRQFITDTVIVDSASDGIGRAWMGDPIDFIGTNTFERIRHCYQSFPRPAWPEQCPDPLPCPG